MFEKINELYGLHLKASSEKALNDLPVYMVSGRTFYNVSYGEASFLLVCINDIDRFGSTSLLKQLRIYQRVSNVPVAYGFSHLTIRQRASLIQKQIPFIVEPDQIYLPFMGILLKNSLSNKKVIVSDKMMPATQSLFLHLLYHAKDGCLKKDAAEYLGLTRMSISRASEQLSLMQLIREEKHGKEISMYPLAYGKDFYEMAKPYLIDPVQSIIYVQSSRTKLLYSGESALEKITMLNGPKMPVYAVNKKNIDLSDYTVVDPDWSDADEICAIELWKYDPAKFSDNGVVDPVSLILSFKGECDERLSDALDEYWEKWKW